jgi:drug/metabolite transporter (DMT)-like permease
MRARVEPRLLPLAVLLVAQLAVGSAALMARAGLGHGLSALSLATWRLTIASLLLVGLLRFRPRPDSREGTPLTRRDRLRLLGAGVCLALHFLTWFASLRYIPIARSTLLVTTTPVWSGLADALLLGRRLPVSFWVGLALACAGAWGVTMVGAGVAPGGFAAGPPLLGDALAVAGAVLMAAYYLLVQSVQHRQGTGRTVAWTYSVAALALWPASLLAGGTGLLPSSIMAWAAVIGLALVPQLVGHTALNWSLTRFSAGKVATATLLEPVFAGALAWVLLGERITAIQAFGAAILLAGVATALSRGGTEEPADR